jgi:hypothetical protein
MTAIMRVPRTRGAGSGILLILLGAWGGLIPFIGPYFHFAYTPDHAWAWTWGRFFLEVLPGAAAVLGGLVLMASAFRPTAIVGAWLAAAAGAWFAVGTLLAPVWSGYVTLGVRRAVPAALQSGTPVGGPAHIVAEHLTFFTGLGVVIVFIAALALGRLTLVAARDAGLAAAEEEPMATAPAAAGTPAAASDERSGTGMWHRPTTAG